MSSPKLQPKPWTPCQAPEYAEAGNLLRHYSSSRTAVLTIAIPICVGILGWVLAVPPRTRLTLYLLFAELLVFGYALILSLFFSAKYEQTRRILIRIEMGEDAAVYNNIAGARLRGAWKLDSVDKSLILTSLLLHSAYYIYYFAR
jgi:hypothetical protein